MRHDLPADGVGEPGHEPENIDCAAHFHAGLDLGFALLTAQQLGELTLTAGEDVGYGRENLATGRGRGVTPAGERCLRGFDGRLSIGCAALGVFCYGLAGVGRIVVGEGVAGRGGYPFAVNEILILFHAMKFGASGECAAGCGEGQVSPCPRFGMKWDEEELVSPVRSARRPWRRR